MLETRLVSVPLAIVYHPPPIEGCLMDYYYKSAYPVGDYLTGGYCIDEHSTIGTLCELLYGPSVSSRLRQLDTERATQLQIGRLSMIKLSPALSPPETASETPSWECTV